MLFGFHCVNANWSVFILRLRDLCVDVDADDDSGVGGAGGYVFWYLPAI